MDASLIIEAGQTSIAGVKPRNEDACGFHIPKEPLLTTKGIAVVIADGMSTSDAGDLASETCVNGFLSDYISTPESWTVKTSSQKILSSLNQWLHGQGHRDYGSDKGMVTTLSTMVLKSNTAHIFHVGDTRIYRLRNKTLEQLTRDHRIKTENDKTYLARAIGIDLHLDIDYKTTHTEVSDIYVLVTDGVYEFLTDAKIKKIALEFRNDPQASSEAIVEAAKNNNSDDNLTCQIINIKQLPTENKDEFYHKLTELPFPPPLEQGQILDGYKILRHLHSAKRTEVYLVEDTETGVKVILKAPSINFSDDPEFINRFQHEEWAGRRIKNPHVLEVLEVKRNRTALYYITEYVEGLTLRQWMNDNPRPSLNTVRNFVGQITRGLRAFHRMEMIHQDLKPENIIVDEHETLKIIDFGSVKIPGVEEITTPVAENNLLGTINYTAPEYHLGEAGNTLSDIFSLGTISYEMLTGKLPYNKDLNARNIRQLQYRSVKHFNPEIPVWVDKAIEKSVQINPEQRFSKLSEFTFALTQPDSGLVNQGYVPLIKRNPIKVWQAISTFLLILNLILFYLLT